MPDKAEEEDEDLSAESMVASDEGEEAWPRYKYRAPQSSPRFDRRAHRTRCRRNNQRCSLLRYISWPHHSAAAHYETRHDAAQRRVETAPRHIWGLLVAHVEITWLVVSTRLSLDTYRAAGCIRVRYSSCVSHWVVYAIELCMPLMLEE